MELNDGNRKEVRDQWWRNPRKNLLADDVINNIRYVKIKAVRKKGNFWSAFHDRLLEFVVKIFYTNEHPLYNSLGSSVCRLCYKRPIHILYKKTSILLDNFFYDTEYLFTLFRILCFGCAGF